MNHPEHTFHVSIAELLDRVLLPPAMWTTFPAGHIKLPIQAAAKLARLGLKRSWPDILVLHGVLHGIELKAAGGALSRTRIVKSKAGAIRVVEGQTVVFPRLRAAGMKIAVCETIDDVLASLWVWGVPMRVDPSGAAQSARRSAA